MSRHTQHYLDLNPEHSEDPPVWAVILGALFAVLTLWVLTVFLFSL